jgi:hypothetical protein
MDPDPDQPAHVRLPTSSSLPWRFVVMAAVLMLPGTLPVLAADDAPPPLAPAPSGPEPQPPPQAGAAAASEAVDGGDVWAPSPSKADPKTPKALPDVTIEQKHIGRRVAELVVTPAGFTYHYTLDHLDGMDAGSVLQPHPELSTPRFFRFDF